jgi:hypothetical protein
MSSTNKQEPVTAAELPLSMSVEYVAAQTGLSKSGLRNHIKCGNLKSIKLGARTVVTRESLLDFLSHSWGVPAKVKRDQPPVPPDPPTVAGRRNGANTGR